MSLNKHKIIPLIESYYHTFTPLERTIADFFIHNTEEQDFSSRNISGLLYVSEASLSRFAQKCGFHGYREFIYEYKQSLAPGPEENIPNFEVSEFNTYQELLNKSNALLDKAQITRITNLLVSKPRVYVYGRGSSGLVAQEMKLRFMRIGLNIEAVTDSHIMKVNSVILDENCLVIGEEKSVEFTISNKAMNIVDEDGNRYIAGKHFRLFAGVSQPDTRSAELTGHKPAEVEIAL